jgi:hypothetical protein
LRKLKKNLPFLHQGALDRKCYHLDLKLDKLSTVRLDMLKRCEKRMRCKCCILVTPTAKVYVTYMIKADKCIFLHFCMCAYTNEFLHNRHMLRHVVSGYAREPSGE